MSKPLCNLIIDSCCDLPYAMVNRPGITLLKFPYRLSDGDHLDDMFTTQSPHEFYQAIRNGEMPTTAQIALSTLLVTLTNAAVSKVPTVFLCFGSGLSGTYDTACMALDQVKVDHPDAEIHIVDTKAACIAEGLLVAEAMRQRELGLTADELQAWALEALNYVNCLFMVDDLDSLARGGRLPSVGAYLGSKLDVKPLCNFDLEGHLSMIGLARGRKKGIKSLVDCFSKKAIDETPTRCIICHSDCEKDFRKLKESILKERPDAIIVETNVGPVIGSHVGPGMVAVAFWGPDRRETISFTDKLANSIKER